MGIEWREALILEMHQQHWIQKGRILCQKMMVQVCLLRLICMQWNEGWAKDLRKVIYEKWERLWRKLKLRFRITVMVILLGLFILIVGIKVTKMLFIGLLFLMVIKLQMCWGLQKPLPVGETVFRPVVLTWIKIGILKFYLL